MDGGRTRSRIANAPGVIGPKLANVASADSCDSDTGDCGRRNRSCRASRITASDRSLANRLSLSITGRTLRQNAGTLTTNHRDRTPQAMLISMSDQPGKSIEPPPLPAVLLDPWPIISIGVLGTSIFLWQRAAARRGARGAQSGLTTQRTK